MDEDAAPTNIRIGYPERDDFDIPNAPLRAYCEYCLSVKPAGNFAERRHFAFEQLKPWLGYIMIAEYVPETEDFRYRLYGTAVADQTSFDLTGTLVSERPSKIGDFIARHYREAVGRKLLVYTEHTREYPRFTREWHRLICPVVDNGRIQVVTCIFSVNTKERPL